MPLANAIAARSVGGFECFEARSAVVGPDEMGAVICAKAWRGMVGQSP